MKPVMKVIRQLPWVSSQSPTYCATIGFFDGVHKGHRFLLEQVKREAALRGLSTLAVTFSDHPRRALQTDYRPLLLTTADEKIKWLADCQLDACMVLDFTSEMASLTAQEFMRSYLYEGVGVRCLVIGHDHRFGCRRAESFDDYVRYGAEMGMEVVQASAFCDEGVTMSSSVVRRMLEGGRVKEAAFALGRPYALYGTVVEGRRVGRNLGFPTANLQPESPDLLVPALGVYAVWAEVDGQRYPAMLNIGRRPTLDNGTDCSIEAHLFGFSGDLYGKSLRLHFIERLRNEQKFASLDELRHQLQMDAAITQRLLEG